MDGDGHLDSERWLDFPPRGVRGFAVGGQPVSWLARRKSRIRRKTSRKTGSSRTPVAGTTTRVRQSVLYSNLPRRSGGRRGRELSQELLPVEEHAGEVSSSDSESSTPEVLPELKALGLTGTPPKFEISPCWSNYCADDASGSESDSEIVEESKPKEESDLDIEEERRELEKYFEENTCSTFRETCVMLRDIERARLAAKKDKMSAARRADIIARAPYFLEERQKLQAREQASREEAAMQILLRRQPRRGVSDKEIIQNARKWMSKEVMVAFEEYKKRSPTLAGHDCQLVELGHQCFNVENYCNVFHHFNFKVKIENPITNVSRVSVFFAELREMFGQKYYFCSPLESDSENVLCLQ
ncbi:uncharacterized protein LOC124666248 isoform X2 [Lolium rigidum]|uniref:uncharacterized protein LOC124666248 isoform X2 n=1 Tax=Lolium rigidum TaxID=89674 RepID=UPI001F5D2587|nr:uncharacterized protein LOC124666248 isoform X2 [Lolium rigidum]